MSCRPYKAELRRLPRDQKCSKRSCSITLAAASPGAAFPQFASCSTLQFLSTLAGHLCGL